MPLYIRIQPAKKYKLLTELTKGFPMRWIVDDSMTNFKFWSGGEDRAKMLEYSELEELDSALEAYFGNKIPTATEINDLFWYDFGTVCSLIGLTYDKEHDVIVRDEEEGVPAAIEAIRKDNPALAEAIEAGYKACFESVGAETYSPDITLDDKPNFTVILASDSMDPHPARVNVDAYDEADAIDKATTSLYEHGMTGYVEEETPEFPQDYIEVTKGYVYSPLVKVSKCDTSRGVIRGAYVPEIFLSALVNGDESGLEEQDIQDLREFEEDCARDGINASSLSPVCGPDGEFWDVDEDFRTGNSVFCTEFVSK